MRRNPACSCRRVPEGGGVVKWVVKRQNYGGGTSVIAGYESREAAEQYAADLNGDYQSDMYYVEAWKAATDD